MSSLISRRLAMSVAGSRAFSTGLAASKCSFKSLSRGSSAASASLASLGKSGLLGAPVRYLNLHEYQSKGLMETYGIRVQKGKVAATADEAAKVSQQLLDDKAAELVIKAQIHAGGRGKGTFASGFKGGVKLAKTPGEIKNFASKFLGDRLITAQTGPEGQLCQKVLVHESINFQRELYFAIVMDRKHQGPVVVASTSGGMDIEEVAHKTPDKIFTVPIAINSDAKKVEQIMGSVSKYLGFTGSQATDATDQMQRLYNLFLGEDATQVEINPFVVAGNGKVYCVDAKINFDDNASFRHESLFAQRDFSMEDPREVAASKFNLNYIGLDGNIGCMVNGAGLAMATMDIIKLHGGSPANFLDVGGGANEKQVEEAFKILTSDPKVKALLVNIFGGIMKCDTIANGIVAAAKSVGLKIPLVVRLEGTNVELGNKILANSGLPIITARDLDQAALQAVKALKR